MGCLFCLAEPASAELEQQWPALFLTVAMLLLQILHQQFVLVAPVQWQGDHQLIAGGLHVPIGQQVVLAPMVGGNREAQNADATLT